MKVATFGDGALMDSICRSCGECVVRCPVGALTFKDSTRPRSRGQDPSAPTAASAAPCTSASRTTRSSPCAVTGTARPTTGGSVSRGVSASPSSSNHHERLRTPLFRKDGQFVEATWDEALSLVADKLAGFKGNEIAVISSAKATNEDNYVVQKLARAVLDTHNVDHCARL